MLGSEMVTLSDGRIFPRYQDETLSWSIGLYFTWEQERIGYPKARTVIRAMLAYRPEQLERERIDALKSRFDSIFGRNATKLLNLIQDETQASI